METRDTAKREMLHRLMKLQLPQDEKSWGELSNKIKKELDSDLDELGKWCSTTTAKGTIAVWRWYVSVETQHDIDWMQDLEEIITGHKVSVDEGSEASRNAVTEDLSKANDLIEMKKGLKPKRKRKKKGE